MYKNISGRPYPLGATFKPGTAAEETGVNFALFSGAAEKVELCLFDSVDASHPRRIIPVLDRTDQVWHVFVPGLLPGQLYAYRVYGPYSPEHGLRFNHNKFLLDPYAKALGRDVTWDETLFAYQRVSGEDDDLYLDPSSNGLACPLAQVAPILEPIRNSAPAIPWSKTVIYEAHVKGLSYCHPGLDPEVRGTYAALAAPEITQHLLSLGITTLELLPIHHRVSEWSLLQNGLSNYWGYNTLGYFLPDSRFASSKGFASIAHEFRSMVDALHAAGIEVILDVVYNHTAEGNHLGPSLSFRGIDNLAYYRVQEKHPRYYSDFTGCGNSINVKHPRVLQLIADSLRYWSDELHVDGFRFDLAPVLGRDELQMDPNAAFFDIINQDPVLSRKKLIAEPWDLGDGGYQLGNFPIMWREWNGRYRDNVRSFWKGDKRCVGALASRLSGSSEIFGGRGRGPDSSINFITCHDGFTLRDLVSYNSKHNLNNCEDNRDGNNENRSWNCGHEGPTSKTQINALRLRQQKNLLSTLFFSLGVPMVLAGDEFGRSQNGNNNSYCQDNQLNWISWEETEESKGLLAFIRSIVELRKSIGIWDRTNYFVGERCEISGERDVFWFRKDGQPMEEQDWSDPELHCLGVWLGRRAINNNTAHAPAYLMLYNAENKKVNFSLPKVDKQWELLLDTAQEPSVLVQPSLVQQNLHLKAKYAMVPHSFVLFRELI